MRLVIIYILISFSQLAWAQNWDKLNKESLSYYNDGLYEAAMPAMQRTMAVAEKKYGIESVEYITSLNNYTFLQKAMGNLPDALEGFREVCRLSQLVYGLRSIEYIEGLNNKATLFQSMAVYDSCENNLAKAKELIFSQAETQSLYYLDNLLKFFNALISNQTTLASLYYNRGQLKKAITILEEQVESMEDAYGDYTLTDNNYNIMLGNLSTYYLDAGRLDEAKSLVKKSIESEVKINGTSGYQYFYLRNNLASIYRTSYQLDSALSIWQRTENELTNSDRLGSEIHMVILTNMGELMLEEEKSAEAILYLTKSKKLHEKRAGLIPNLYQVTIFNLAKAYQGEENYLQADLIYQQLVNQLSNSLIHEFTYLTEEEKRAFYANQLHYINEYLSFAFEVAYYLPLQGNDGSYVNPQLGGQLYNLQLLTKASIISSSSKMRSQIMSGDQELRKKYQSWERKKNNLATLYSSGYTDTDHISFLAKDIDRLESELTRASAQFKNGFTVSPTTWQEVQAQLKEDEAAVEIIRILDGLAYLAVIITPEVKIPVLSLALSTHSKKLDVELYNYYKNAIRYKVKDTLSYNVYWQAISDTIIANTRDKKMPRKVYLSADGIYSQINLNTLFNPKTNSYLIDETEIHLLTNTKDLVENSDTKDIRYATNKAVLMGNPKYTLNSYATSGYFSSLPGTSVELDQINEHLLKYGWQTTVYSGASATVGNLKANRNMRVLNLATHGFFNRSKTDDFYEILLSSGLAFAGANHSFSFGGEDGILTAYEAVNLELDSTELVVLSACETGKGEYHPGDGVYGLQRAIKVAGAKSILMSLWKVDDTATQELMVNFYRNWIPDNDKRVAFRKAQQELRLKFPEPYYWGAFIMVGN